MNTSADQLEVTDPFLKLVVNSAFMQMRSDF